MENDKLLLKYGAEANSVLLLASVMGYTETVKILVDCGAEVNLQGIDGWSALMGASLEGHFEIVQILLDHDAQVNMLDSKGNSALIYASYLGDIQIPFLTDNGKCSALHRGSKEEYIKTVRLLLEYGAKVDMKNSKGISAQIVACSTNNTEILKVLINCGSQIDFRSVEIAKKRNYTERVDLLEKGHTISSIDAKPTLDESAAFKEIKRLKEHIKRMEASFEEKLREHLMKILAVMLPVEVANSTMQAANQREEVPKEFASKLHIMEGQSGLISIDTNNGLAVIKTSAPQSITLSLKNLLTA